MLVCGCRSKKYFCRAHTEQVTMAMQITKVILLFVNWFRMPIFFLFYCLLLCWFELLSFRMTTMTTTTTMVVIIQLGNRLAKHAVHIYSIFHHVIFRRFYDLFRLFLWPPFWHKWNSCQHIFKYFSSVFLIVFFFVLFCRSLLLWWFIIWNM